MSTDLITTRRDFLKGSAAATGALVIGFTGPRVSTFVILREGETGNDPVAGLSPRWLARP